MASVMLTPSRALLEAYSPIRKHTARNCVKVVSIAKSNTILHNRNVSTAPKHRSEMEVDGAERPRWSQTPPAMAAPYPAKSRPPNWQPYKVNSDPKKLDEVYSKVLGANGPKLLSEETKWLAVTHKSFDHGRRGFNERLAFLGKRILELQTSLGLLSSMDATRYLKTKNTDPHGRESFVHPATANVEVLLGNAKSYLMHHKQIARLAEHYSIPSVVRWQPKNPDNLHGSGCDMVYAQVVYAIIGALAMEQGGAVATRIARERVIQPTSIEKGIAMMSEGLEKS